MKSLKSAEFLGKRNERRVFWENGNFFHRRPETYGSFYNYPKEGAEKRFFLPFYNR